MRPVILLEFYAVFLFQVRVILPEFCAFPVHKFPVFWIFPSIACNSTHLLEQFRMFLICFFLSLPDIPSLLFCPFPVLVLVPCISCLVSFLCFLRNLFSHFNRHLIVFPYIAYVPLAFLFHLADIHCIWKDNKM